MRSSETDRCGSDCRRRVSGEGSPPPPRTLTAKPRRISVTRYARNRTGAHAVSAIGVRSAGPCATLYGPMPLTLVTGPANAEKAGHVLAAYRAALEREPLLVVPTAGDVERYRRELAAAGAVFGVQVLRFAWLERELARRAGVTGRPLGALARERGAGAAGGGRALGRVGGGGGAPVL